MEGHSALAFERAGVRFGHEDGEPTVFTTDDALLERVLAERERRGRLMLARAPAQGRWPLIRIVDREPARWGECLTCGEATRPHYGGMCPLCVAGLLWALREAGKR